MKKTLKLQMDALLENQALARAITVAFVSQLDPTMDELSEIKTAVSEAFSNASIHAYSKDLPGSVYMEFSVIAPSTVMIKVWDKGVGIEDIAKAMEPLYTTDESRECSGMGFTVMESFMDKIKVDSAPGEGTTVTMTKKIDTYLGS